MYRKLSKQGIFFIGILVLCLIVIVVFVTSKKLINYGSNTNTFIVEQVVAENQILKVQLLDFISKKNTPDKATSQTMMVEAKENIVGESITNKQSFVRVMNLLAPNDNVRPFLHDGKIPSHNAYILVLLGDVIKYVDSAGNEKYVIENARIEYYMQAVLLEEAYNSVYISSIDGKKEKMVKVDDYKQAMSSIDTYYEMLQWE